MEELTTAAEVLDAAGGDPRLWWAAQATEDGRLGPGVRAFAYGGAAAVASPRLSGRDRLAVHGPAAEAAPLVRAVLDETGPSFRPFGPAELVRALPDAVPGLRVAGEFVRMDTTRRPEAADEAATATGRLAPSDGPAVDALLDAAFPASPARPGGAGVRRWAGLYPAGAGPSRAGAPLLAAAADAWSAAGAGFLAGVAVRPQTRGRGLALGVCGFVADALVREHGSCALMVDLDNPAAIRTYRRLGFTGRRVAAAAVDPGR